MSEVSFFQRQGGNANVLKENFAGPTLYDNFVIFRSFRLHASAGRMQRVELAQGAAQSAIETEHQPKSAPLSNRERWLTLLMLAFLGVVLLSRFSHSPRRWRSVDASMSPQEVSATLGIPTFEGTNEMRWREKHLLGNWELIAERKGTHVTSIRKAYHWPGADGK